MMDKVFIVTYAILLSTGVVHFVDVNGIKITLYYETLCEASTYFFSDIYLPNYEEFKDCVKWDFVPFGMAKLEKDANGKVVNVTCAHGPKEIWGDKIQACALNKLSDKKFEFCSCFMAQGGDTIACDSCTKDIGVDSKVLQDCANSEEGLDLLAAMGERTSKLQPAIDGVPTFVIDDTEVIKDNQDFEENFVENICKRAKDCSKCADEAHPKAPTPP